MSGDPKPEPWSLEPDRFTLTDPARGRSWANYLSNPDYGLRLNQFAAGWSSTLDEPRLLVTHHGWNQEDRGRHVYLREAAPGQEPWNPGFLPCRTPLDTYRAVHGLGWSSFEGERRGIVCESRHFLPRAGRFEVWRIRIENRGARPVRLTVAAQAEFLLQSSSAVDVPYYSWYQDVRPLADGSGVEAVNAGPGSRPALGFFRSLVRPSGYEGSLKTFFGTGDAIRPQMLEADRAADSPGAGDPPAACLRFDLELAPGQRWETAVFLGEGADALEDCRDRLHSLEAVAVEEAAVRREWQNKVRSRTEFSFSNTELDDWLHGFFAYQIRQQAQGLVRTGSRGFRDAAQDSIGLGFYDLGASRALILDLARHQHRDGRCLRQWSLCGGPHDERDFRDLPFWMVLAVFRYLEAGGDPGILAVPIPYLEDGVPETLFGHLKRGLEYVLRFGPHDLLLIGTGDWNDALSNLGPGGESLWLNQFAYLCLEQFGTLVDRWGTPADRHHGLDLPALRERLYAGVAAGWTGQWFLRGYHESGAVLGGPERIFLLPQAWFTISGMAARDPARATAALESMVTRLDHPDGLLKCDPAFSSYDPSVGNLTALTPGMAENFAVYNHASVFGAYALFLAGRREAALRTASRLLPFRKDSDRTKAEPYVLVNYYNGGHYADHAGRGGISWLTGTANWLAMLLFDCIIPAKVEWEPDEAQRDGHAG